MRERLDLAPWNAGRIAIEVRDAAAADADPIVPFDGAAFQTLQEGKRIVIRVHAEFVMNGTHDLEKGIAHEMVYAVMRDLTIEEAYARIPHRLREGIAVWAAGQGEDRARDLLTSARSRKDPEALFPGLEEGKHELDRYAEDYLAFAFLVASEGERAPARLVKELFQGTEVREALKRVTGLEWVEFRDGCREHARSRIEAFRPPEWGEYAKVLEWNKSGAKERHARGCISDS